MLIELPDISFPVTVSAGESINPNDHLRPFEESFSQEFRGHVPRRIMMELAAAFLNSDGCHATELYTRDEAIKHFCQFYKSRKLKIPTLSLLPIQVSADFVSYLKDQYPKQSYWTNLAWRFGRMLKDLDERIAFPKIPKPDVNPTHGHTPEAFEGIMTGLKQEALRIREKIGRYNNDINIGHVFSNEEMGQFRGFRGGQQALSRFQIREIRGKHANGAKYKSLAREYGVDWRTIKNYVKGAYEEPTDPKAISREDIIATIMHWLPNWPFQGSLGDTEQKYRVYESEKGRLLGAFPTLGDSEVFAKKSNGIIRSDITYSSHAQLNPGELLLAKIINKDSTKKKSKNGVEPFESQVLSLFPSYADLTDYYFPTTYDLTCIGMYWSCLTGWNAETIQSVDIHQLKLIFGGKGTMDLISDDHALIIGTKKRGKKSGETEGKHFSHVSEKNNEFGLYRVLVDYYEASKPLRRFLVNDEQNCILVCMPVAGKKRVSMFGPTKSPASIKSLISKSNSQVKTFFDKHEVFEAESGIRVESTNSRRLRTTYETILEVNDVPLEIRRMFMGHETMDTTMLPYGLDPVARALRFKEIRKNLTALEEKAFKGQLAPLLPPEELAEDGNVIQIFSFNNNPIFECRNPYKPTFNGHERYVKKGAPCDLSHKCFFCTQSRITKDTLPHCYRWLEQLNHWRREVGGADFGMELHMYYRAILEVFELCENAGDLWREALAEAEALANDPEFISPILGPGI